MPKVIIKAPLKQGKYIAKPKKIDKKKIKIGKDYQLA